MFSICNDYANENGQDFLVYWIEHSTGIRDAAGDEKVNKLVNLIHTYREKNPGKPTEVFFMPHSIRMLFRSLDNYDPRFGVTFYDGTWNEEFDHEKTLKKITSPTLLLHANYNYREDGILMGAMDDNDAARAASLIKGCNFQRIDSGHTMHLDKPKEFIRIVREFFQ